MQLWTRKIPDELKDLIRYIDDSKDNKTIDEIIEYILKHPGMHFQMKNLTHEFVTLILYSLYIDFEQLMWAIFYKFKREIDLSALVSSGFIELIEPSILEVFFKEYTINIKNNKFVSPSKIYEGAIRKSQTYQNYTYWDIVKDNAEFLNELDADFYNDVLRIYNIDFYSKDETVKMIKYSFKYEAVLNGFLSIAKENVVIMKLYFPEAQEIFLF